MDYKPDKFSKWAVRLVILLFVAFALSFAFLRQLVLDQDTGEALWGKSNIADALLLLLSCVAAGVIWALVNYVRGKIE